MHNTRLNTCLKPVIDDHDKSDHEKEGFNLQFFINARSLAQQEKINTQLPELVSLEALLLKYTQLVRLNLATTIYVDDLALPIYEIIIGNYSVSGDHHIHEIKPRSNQPFSSEHQKSTLQKQPHLLLVAGIHGLERIGSRVLISLLTTWLERLLWEKSLQHSLTEMEITFVPIANPAGMYLNQRSNANGVDLMRNAPIDAQDKVSFLLGGQRISSKFLWYRGNAAQMEQENLALEKIVKHLCQSSRFLLSLDCHSGFGFHDQIWFPYAYRRKPIADIASIFSLKQLFDKGYPHHRYIFEPQSRHYLTHGDLWDHLYKNNPNDVCTFIPLTLELGAWSWLKKKPSQLFSMQGLFNPMTPHRQQRTLRRHLPFLDFLRHACYSVDNWLPDEEAKQPLLKMANKHWYPEL